MHYIWNRSGKMISSEFDQQNVTMKRTSSKLNDIVTIVPGLDQIMNRIWCLRTRNNCIIGCVVAILIILLFILWK